jgi:CDP-glucose 4,6-dehydratase
MSSVDFWTDKRVLVTGHTGFKGAWLSSILSLKGAKLFGVSDEVKSESLFSVCNISSVYYDQTIEDLRQLDVCKVIDSFQPEIIFHLAAQSIVSESYLYPKNTFANNINSTLNLLDGINNSNSMNLKAVIVVTSDKCYRNDDLSIDFTEKYPLGGHDPYSASKACVELVAASYSTSFLKRKGIGIATARAGNVIGGGDFATDRLVPDLFRCMKSGKRLPIRNPRAIRPWQFVLDPLFGYLTLAEKLFDNPEDYAEPWNFGPSSTSFTTVEDFLKIAGERFKFDFDIVVPKFEEKGHLSLDSSKARDRLSWTAKTSIHDSINLTMDWYERYLRDINDMRAFTLNQITHFNFSC